MVWTDGIYGPQPPGGFGDYRDSAYPSLTAPNAGYVYRNSNDHNQGQVPAPNPGYVYRDSRDPNKGQIPDDYRKYNDPIWRASQPANQGYQYTDPANPGAGQIPTQAPAAGTVLPTPPSPPPPPPAAPRPWYAFAGGGNQNPWAQTGLTNLDQAQQLFYDVNPTLVNRAATTYANANPLSHYRQFVEAQMPGMEQDFGAYSATHPDAHYNDYAGSHYSDLLNQFAGFSPHQRGENPEAFGGNAGVAGRAVYR